MSEPEIEIDSQYAVCCPFCGRPAQDEQLCECMTRTPEPDCCQHCGKPTSVGCTDPAWCGDAQMFADLRAEIAQQAETIRQLRAELEGRAKGSEQ